MAQLSERDIALLQNDIDKLEGDNKTLQDGIESDLRDLNNLILADIASKKFVDEKHLQIFELEEEERLLTGKTIIGPVEEDAFSIATNETNVKVYITDGRFKAKKNNISIVDVPIIDSRAYVLSSPCGPDFDIWTRDRHGSATSQNNAPDNFTITEGNNQFTVVIDGIEKTVEIISPDILEASNGELTVDAANLASNLSLSLSEHFEGAQVFYHTVNKGFTVASGTVGPNSTVQVIVGNSPDNIAKLMNFTNQVNISGRYANNKFKIAIDGEEKELEITFDIRIPVTSSLGMAIDDYSADWKTDFSAGPLFPAEPNNGKKIATLLQSKLREVGSGGYKNAECIYYSSSNKFVIYSGSFGSSSSIELFAHSDANRDLLPFLGLVEPTELKSKETAYTTLQSLYDYLNSKSAIICTNLNNPTFKCYSLLMIENGVSISTTPYILQTTSEYDQASLSKSRLYSGKIIVNSENDKFDTSEGTRTLLHGEYSEGEICEILQSALNVGSTVYTVTYKKSTKTFVITSSASVSFLFNTGVNKSTSIATYIGFQNTSDLTGTSFTSGAISFSGQDFFSMAEIPQLVPMSLFNNKPPYYYDTTVKSEQGLNTGELIFLQSEDNSGGLINNIKTQTDVYNESNIIALENAQAEELTFVNNLISVLQNEISNYSVISTSDSIYTNLVTALNNAITAKNNLIAITPSHDYLLNLRSGNISFTYGSAFTQGGVQSLNVSFSAPNGDRIYNWTPIQFKYTDNKYIPMKNKTNIYSNNVTFDLFIKDAFSIKSNVTAISGYSKSAVDANGLFTITSVNNKINITIDGVSNIITLNLGTNLSGQSVASDITAKLQAIGTGGFTNAKCYYNRFDCVNSFKIFSGTTGVSSTVSISDEIGVISSSNNKIDFEDSHTQVTNQVIGSGDGLTATYSGTLNPRVVPSSITISATIGGVVRNVTDNGLGSLIGYVGTGSNSINYLTGSYSVTFAGNIDNATNVTITYQYYTLKTATIANGTYNGTTLATAVASALNSASSGYSCTYSTSTNKFTISSTNPYFNLRFATGTNTANTSATILGFSTTDFTGSLSYTSSSTTLISAVTELNYSTQTTDTGHAITDTRITITDTYISSRTYWSGGDSEHFYYDFLTYPNVKALVDIINSDFSEYDISIGKSTLWSRKPEKFQINNGEQFQIKINNGSTQTITFNLTRGQITSSGGQTSANANDTLILSLNSESAKTITFPVPTSTGSETAAMIQSLVRSLIATNPENQLAYSNFTCTYSGNYVLSNGIYGSGSTINVLGGTLSSKLNISGSNSGSGPFQNNFAITSAQLVSALSITGATVTNDNGFLKIQANNSNEKLEIISNALSTRLGFYSENLISETSVEYTTVNCASIINVSNQSIQSTPYVATLGYENRGNINATFQITDNARLNNRLTQVTSRKSYLASRQSQIISRLSTINSSLSIALYSSRWTEVVKRLNKKTGSYYKVGDKQLAIERSQQLIIENNAKIAEMKSMLGV